VPLGFVAALATHWCHLNHGVAHSLDKSSKKQDWSDERLLIQEQTINIPLLLKTKKIVPRLFQTICRFLGNPTPLPNSHKHFVY